MWQELYMLGEEFKDTEPEMEVIRHIDAGIRQMGYPQWPLTGSRQEVQDYLNDVAATLRQSPAYARRMSGVTWNFANLTDYYTGK
jgi:hypothetical protein